MREKSYFSKSGDEFRIPFFALPLQGRKRLLTGFSIGVGFSGLCFSFGGSLTGSEIIDPDSVAQLGLLFFRFLLVLKALGEWSAYL